MKRVGTLVTAMALIAGSAMALPQRTFVSAKTGSDANIATNCALTTPCRNFAAAVGVTTAGGEVVALDSGGYGVVTIDRAITVVGPPGVYAAISAFSTDAITVSAPGDALVILRGLTLNGLGGSNGVNCSAIGELVVEDAHISNFPLAGVLLGGPINFRISRSSFVADGHGVLASAIGQTTAIGQVLHSYFENTGGIAVRADTGASIDVVDSAAFNGYVGFNAVNGGTLSCTRCTATHNQYGIGAQNSGGVTRVNNCVVTYNSIAGLFNYSANLESMGNSMVESNATDVVGAKTPFAAQ